MNVVAAAGIAVIVINIRKFEHVGRAEVIEVT